MNPTMPCPAVPVPLLRPWWQRLADTLVDRWRAWRQPVPIGEADLHVLIHLSPQTLRDIGAPDWVQERARGAADPWTQTGAERRPWWWLP